jgi:hypothetical protein
MPAIMHAIARERSAISNGRETPHTGRLREKATMRKVTVVVCLIPVDCRRVSNMATSPVVK